MAQIDTIPEPQQTLLSDEPTLIGKGPEPDGERRPPGLIVALHSKPAVRDLGPGDIDLSFLGQGDLPAETTLLGPSGRPRLVIAPDLFIVTARLLEHDGALALAGDHGAAYRYHLRLKRLMEHLAPLKLQDGAAEMSPAELAAHREAVGAADTQPEEAPFAEPGEEPRLRPLWDDGDGGPAALPDPGLDRLDDDDLLFSRERMGTALAIRRRSSERSAIALVVGSLTALLLLLLSSCAEEAAAVKRTATRVSPGVYAIKLSVPGLHVQEAGELLQADALVHAQRLRCAQPSTEVQTAEESTEPGPAPKEGAAAKEGGAPPPPQRGDGHHRHAALHRSRAAAGGGIAVRLRPWIRTTARSSSQTAPGSSCAATRAACRSRPSPCAWASRRALSAMRSMSWPAGTSRSGRSAASGRRCPTSPCPTMRPTTEVSR